MILSLLVSNAALAGGGVGDMNNTPSTWSKDPAITGKAAALSGQYQQNAASSAAETKPSTLNNQWGTVNNTQSSYQNQVRASNTMNQAALTPVDKQHQSEQNTATSNQQGRDQAQKLGNSQTALGMALVAAGMATPCIPCGPGCIMPPCPPIIAAGMMMKGQGQKSYKAAGWMNQTGSTANGLKGNLNSRADKTATDGSSVGFESVAGDGNGVDIGAEIDQAATGGSLAFFNALKGSGLSLDDIKKNGGLSMDAIRKKYPNVGASAWDAAMNKANKYGQDPNDANAKDLFAGTGASWADQAKAAMGDGLNGGASLSELLAGAGAAGANGNSLDSLLKDFNGASSGEGSDVNSDGKNASVGNGIDGLNGQNAMRGIASYGDRSIFEQISKQYRKQQPSLLSVDYFIRDKMKEGPKDVRDALKQGPG